MKNKKFYLEILIVFLVFLFSNFLYFLWVNSGALFKNKNSSSSEIIVWKKYNNIKIGFELEYPPLWLVNDSTEDIVKINPPEKEAYNYFSVGIRDDFKSLDEIKRTLSPSLPITPIEIDGASGFKYSDTSSHDMIWLSHSDKIYLIMVYFANDKANQVLFTFKFIN
ncbi:MAG: hypothetical protein WC884_00910 [Candidatus Paceibacterota bacterium]